MVEQVDQIEGGVVAKGNNALLVGKRVAAELCGISARSVDRLVSCGRFPPPVRLGGRRLWNRARLAAWVGQDCPRIGEGTR